MPRDKVLGSGTKQGYEVAPSLKEPTRQWIAVASPSVPGATGALYFAIREDGTLVQRQTAPFDLDADRPLSQKAASSPR